MSSIFSKPDPPTPPNPIDTARAATGTNVGTAIANAQLQNINQVTPGGNLNYSTTGNYAWTDPTTQQTYNIPQFTATQTLTPQGEAIQGQQLATQYNLASMANSQSNRIGGLLSNNLDLSGAPAAGNASGLSNIPAAATSYASGGPIQSQLGPLGDITKTYGPEDNFSADRQRVEDALMARMNPQLAIQKQGLQQQLADQGLRYGSRAYADAMQTYNQQENDARFGAIAQGGQEQQRMNQMAAQLAAFQNQAQGQGYEQTLGAAGFGNQAQQQQYQQNALQAQFGNAGLAQQMAQQQAAFNAAQAGRNQYMQESYAQRNQPINEITALLGGSQVQQPNFVSTPGAQIPTTDIGGLLNQNFNQQLGIYNTQTQNANQLLGGILGFGGKVGGAALGMSDRREKENISRIGTVFATDPDHDEKKKLPIYEYSYKKDPASVMHTGPMAQDVEKVDPRAVKNIEGKKYLDMNRMGSVLGVT